MGKQWKSWHTLFAWAAKSLQMMSAAMKLRNTCSLEEKLCPTRLCIKKQRHYFVDKSQYCQRYRFSSSYVWMWDLDYKEGWAPKNWSFWTVVLEKTLESSLDRKDIKPVNLKGNQSWILIGGTDAETKAPILWPPDVKSQIIGKDPDAGKDWVQEGKGMTEDGMVGWHPWLNGQEFEQALRNGKGQRNLACWSP